MAAAAKLGADVFSPRLDRCRGGGPAALLQKQGLQLRKSSQAVAQKGRIIARPIERFLPPCPCFAIRACDQSFLRKGPAKETSSLWLVFQQMDSQRQSTAATEKNLDRTPIRVDIPPAHAGITAALRRAFAPANGETCERDFNELLRRLN